MTAIPPAGPSSSEARERYARYGLDPTLVHLNHGSFGAVPVEVATAARHLQDRARANPTHFLAHEAPALVAQARDAGCAFLGLEPGSLALVRNATEAASTVLRIVEDAGAAGPGAEVVVNSHGYGAVVAAAAQLARRHGGRVVQVPLPVGVDDATVVAGYRAALTDRTALVVVDQITSPTATVLPAADVARAVAADRPGLPTLIDGAHAPGHLQDAEIEQSGAAFWLGNLHKWCQTALGTTGLWIAPEWRDRAHPLVTSWGAVHGFPASFDELGAEDQSGWMTLPLALRRWSDEGGWARVAIEADRVERGAALVREALGTAYGTSDAPLPRRSAPLMRLVALPPGTVADLEGCARLYEGLLGAGVVTMVTAHDEQGYLRLSGADYILDEHYARLAEVVVPVLRTLWEDARSAR